MEGPKFIGICRRLIIASNFEKTEIQIALESLVKMMKLEKRSKDEGNS